LLRRQEQQSAVAKRAQVHLVEQAIEVLGLLLDVARELLEGLFHTSAVLALHDDDHVIVVAELVDILLPALKTGLVGTDEIVALGFEFERGEVGVESQAAGDEREAEDEPGVAGAPARDAAEQARNQPGLFVAFRAHRVACLLAAMREADSSSDDGTY